jgi:N-acetylmuramoyl-L-alanine amidase
MKTKIKYSLNFDPKKRKLNNIKFIIFHYTGMKKEIDAINKLTNEESKVSSHYFIKKNGEILTLVPDLYISWHAGISSWKKFKSINKYSIGIEISNIGHDYDYKNFKKKQIKSIVRLSNFLIKKYKIKSTFILGHSDISPDRKIDPGEKFPWKYLAKKKIGIWHDLDHQKIKEERMKKIGQSDKTNFINYLYKIGYSRNCKITKIKYAKILTKAFQRRFRQELINGIIDKECLLISQNLIKKFN